jgi:hypothetical protein
VTFEEVEALSLLDKHGLLIEDEMRRPILAQYPSGGSANNFGL